MSKKAMKICFSIILVVIAFVVATVFLTREKKISIDEKINSGAVLHDGSDTMDFEAEEGNYKVKITSVYETEPVPQTQDAPPAESVVVVVYEYTNEDIKSGLVIGETHFKAYDKSGKSLEIYPQANLFEPDEVDTLGTHTASVAFALNSSENYVEVDYFNDVASKIPDLVYEGIWK